jgi:LPXTG-site transpeptidase (sortase) family protein
MAIRILGDARAVLFRENVYSVLPWFYNPRNYKTIFSTLENLKTGDKIFIKYNNKEYEYKVEDKSVKLPDEVNPLAEYKARYLNESTITLMTCVPAGTKLRRLLVNAVNVN